MSSPEITAFLEASRAWETTEVSRARKSERRAWLFAGLGIAIGLSACLAVAFLTPLKTVEPFVVRVDKSSGGADIISRLDGNTVEFDEAIDKYFLSRYVNYREEYSDALAYSDYEAVSLMSTRQVGDAYYQAINPKNPRSPSKVYGKEGAVEIVVNSIAFLGEGVAQVRFTRTERRPNAEPVETHWIATITYKYSKASMDAKSRLINPVGFQATDYRLDPETTGQTK
ncbi:VirB8/TrbF family protein [Dyella sp. GSA-30]|uniref:virB8 family protein n=1 Tax=Dyella sp. GSA-30 TaxID=2994496 RepID=UPI002493632D|nr:VirB8/TrbF family protein [Dyella sp. GSA-30]BDU18566.1 conjugal transfer protein TraJ [Dyella sp. GSA-30]